MKAAVNGVLNFSVLDGWWCEGYNGANGWIIGSGEEYSDMNYQDEVESKAIYDILEKDIIPLFYQRGHDGLPREWIRKMKTSMQTLCPAFNTNRMIEEYTRQFYNPTSVESEKMTQKHFEVAKKVSAWRSTMDKSWNGIKIVAVEDTLAGDVDLGKAFTVKARIKLGIIRPEDVSVQIFWGYLDSKQRMNMPRVSEMSLKETAGDTSLFEGSVNGDRVGHCGYVLRILPKLDGKVLHIPGDITWQ
jgi:starch phosphorylase